MLAVLVLGVFERLFNRWIDLDAATRLAFNGLQGKLLRIVVNVPQLSVDVLFDADAVRISPTAVGMDETPARSIFEQRPYDKVLAPLVATTTIHVDTFVALAQLLLASSSHAGNMPVRGDLGLLQQLQHIMQTANPDIAYRLSPFLGEVAAQQFATVIEQTKQTVISASKNIASHSAEWLREDINLLAPRYQVERLTRGIQELKLDIERLSAKLKQYEDTPPTRHSEIEA